MDYVKAFLIGGLICALVQILMEKTKMMPGRIMVTLVVTGSFQHFILQSAQVHLHIEQP